MFEEHHVIREILRYEYAGLDWVVHESCAIVPSRPKNVKFLEGLNPGWHRKIGSYYGFHPLAKASAVLKVNVAAFSDS
jgi:hypothetical protein